MSLLEFNNKLKAHLELFNTNPFLFIGSGLSRRYLNLPTWLDLLEEFSKTLELKYEFGYYESQAEGDLPKLASIIADEFYEKWWSSDTFKENRIKFKKEAGKSTQQPFKIELASFIEKRSVLNETFNEEISLLKSLVIDGIITTNWDNFINELLVDFEVFIGQYDLLFSDKLSIGEIFKIHGSIDQPYSIVVTKEDYDSFHRKNQFLAAKLFTIFAEHPIIFLGYSMSDSNIINILNSIVECVDNLNIEKLKDRLIFVQWVEDFDNPEIVDSHIVIKNLTLPIIQIKLKNFSPLYQVLVELKQRLPIRLLRKCRNAVYELVKTNNPTNTILIGDLENIRENENVEFVIGVGVATQYAQQGYIGVSNDDIFEDIIKDNKRWNSEAIIKDVLPRLFKTKVYLPLYKYLRQSGELDDNGQLQKTASYSDKLTEVIENNNVKVYYPKAKTHLNKYSEVRNSCNSVNDVILKYSIKNAPFYIPFLKIENIDLDELLKFLNDSYNEQTKKNTDIKKIICFYDYLKYGIQINIVDHAIAIHGF